MEYQDLAVADLAAMFLANDENPTPGWELLKAEHFNYTLESLAALDSYLEAMRERGIDESEELRCTLRSGAYLGEVIRRQTPKPREWHWLKFEDAVTVNPQIASFGRDLGVFLSLWDGEVFSFPMSKICKFLANGSADSTLLYAQAVVAFPLGA